MERTLVLGPDVRIGTVSHPQIESNTFHKGHWDRSPRRHLRALLAASTNFAVRELRFQFSGRSEYPSFRACSHQRIRPAVLWITSPTKSSLFRQARNSEENHHAIPNFFGGGEI